MSRPVAQRWWRSVRDEARTAAAFPDRIPHRAVLTSPHFDVSRLVPDFVVDRGRLVTEWLVVGATAAIVALVIARGRRAVSETSR